MTNNDLNDNLKSTLLIDNQILKTSSNSQETLQITATVDTIFIVDAAEASPEALQTVKSIAQACQLQEMQYQIIAPTHPWHELKKHDHIKNIILFGELENALALNVQFPIHYIYTFDQKTWIKTVNLNSLNQDKAAKTALWNSALKKHFIK